MESTPLDFNNAGMGNKKTRSLSGSSSSSRSKKSQIIFEQKKGNEDFLYIDNFDFKVR